MKCCPNVEERKLVLPFHGYDHLKAMAWGDGGGVDSGFPKTWCRRASEQSNETLFFLSGSTKAYQLL